MGGRNFNIPIRDRVLVHLKEYIPFKDSLEVPYGMSQAGIAQSLNVNRSQVTRAVQELRTKDLVDIRKTFVEGGSRRQNVYSLTLPGEIYVDRLKKILLMTKVNVKDVLSRRRTVKIKTLHEKLGDDVWFTDLIQSIFEDKLYLFYPDNQKSQDFEVRLGTVEEMYQGPVPVPPKKPQVAVAKAVDPSKQKKEELEVDVHQVANALNYQVEYVKRVLNHVQVSYKDEKVEEIKTTTEAPLYTSVMGTSDYDPNAPKPPAGQPTPTTVMPTGPPVYPGYHQPYQYSTPYGHQAPRKPSISIFILGAILFILGLVSFVLAFALSSGTSSPMCCLGGIMLITIGIIMMTTILATGRQRGLVRMTPLMRMIVIGLGVIGVVTIWMSLMIVQNELTWNEFAIILAIVLPLYGFVLAPGMPLNIRGDIGVATGTALLLSEFILLFYPELISTSPATTALVITFAMGLIMYGAEIGGLGLVSILRAMVPGIGIAALVLCSATFVTYWVPDPLSFAVLVLWIFMGGIMIVVPFLNIKFVKAINGAISRVGLICFGILLTALGIGLMYNGIYIGFVEVFLSVPAFYYGGQRFKAMTTVDNRLTWFFLLLFLVVEIITIARVMWIF